MTQKSLQYLLESFASTIINNSMVFIIIIIGLCTRMSQYRFLADKIGIKQLFCMFMHILTLNDRVNLINNFFLYRICSVENSCLQLIQ